MIYYVFTELLHYFKVMLLYSKCTTHLLLFKTYFTLTDLKITWFQFYESEVLLNK